MDRAVQLLVCWWCVHIRHPCDSVFLIQSRGWVSELSTSQELFIPPFLPPGSVEMTIAVLLVTCIVVVVAILGYCFFRNQRKSVHRYRHGHPPPPTPASSTVSTTEDTEHLVYNHTTRPF